MNLRLTRLILAVLFVAASALAQAVSITAQGNTSGSVDVNATLTGVSPTTPITITKINWYKQDGTFLGSTNINETFTSSGIQPFTFSASQVPAGAMKCMMSTSNGGSDGNTQVEIKKP